MQHLVLYSIQEKPLNDRLRKLNYYFIDDLNFYLQIYAREINKCLIVSKYDLFGSVIVQYNASITS